MIRNPLLVPDLRELIGAGESLAVGEFLADYHPGRVAEVVEDLGEGEGDTVFGLLDPRIRAEVMSYLAPETQVRLVEVMTPGDGAELLHFMSHDERADLVIASTLTTLTRFCDVLPRPNAKTSAALRATNPGPPAP